MKNEDMLKTALKAIMIITVAIVCTNCDKGLVNEKLTQFVNPFVGTGGHGHTYPGTSMPFGMVQLSPDSRLSGWDGCSAYHYSDNVIYGFSHTHLSGTGCSDYGDILIMPTANVEPFADTAKDENGYWYKSSFDHKNETASPGYYSVILDDYSIKAELTATLRSGFHRYTFPKSNQANIVIDLKHRDQVIESEVKIVSDIEIEGFRRSKAWAEDQHVYFVARFSKSFRSSKIAINDKTDSNLKEATGNNLKVIVAFDTEEKEEILVKVGISAVSIDGARKNLEAEIADWDFDAVKKLADDQWNSELNKIQVDGGSLEQKKVFYTALYHSLLNPNLYNDVDGRYRGTDLDIHENEGFDNYSVFSLWDTYRATHPLFTIIEQKRTGDFISTFLTQYENGGKLPVWELSANYTGCMIGYHSIPVIADAYVKGIKGFDIEKLFVAMKHSAELDHLGLDAYREYGYIPADKEHESVSKTLEYAYDDWCIAQVATGLGKQADYNTYIQRAQFYKNIFDVSTGFMRAKKNGAWWEPFDPTEVNFNYTEANSWQYSLYVPQDISGLMDLMGGKENLIKQIDGLFTADNRTTGREQADITGLIGQYAHGNEPSHHMAYLYNYVGQPWKTQQRVREIMDKLYSSEVDGLCGNEDCGQMSSWFVLSAMGFYPVCPGRDEYAIGTPLFSEIKVNLENEKQFKIKANNLSDKNIYIQSATLDGNNYSKSWISHSDIMNGSELVFEMGPEPGNDWGTAIEDIPTTGISDNLIVTAPFTIKGDLTFTDSLLIGLKTNTKGADIFYTTDGSRPNATSNKYYKEIQFDSSAVLKAIAVKEGLVTSHVMVANYKKIPAGRNINIESKYSSQYTGGGNLALIDYIRGGSDFRTGLWQGYDAQDFSAVVDLGKIQNVKRIGAGFLQEIKSWIWMPSEIIYSVSSDGMNFKEIGRIKPDKAEDDYSESVKDYMLENLNLQTRYVRVQAKNYGSIPKWHLGFGGEAWIFVDEIIIE